MQAEEDDATICMEEFVAKLLDGDHSDSYWLNINTNSSFQNENKYSDLDESTRNADYGLNISHVRSHAIPISFSKNTLIFICFFQELNNMTLRLGALLIIY